MFLRCPHCTALVAVANDGAGITRDCPFCHRSMQADAAGVAAVAATPAIAQADAEALPVPQSPAPAPADDAATVPAAGASAPSNAHAAAPVATPSVGGPARRTPSFARDAAAGSRRRFWLAAAAIALLSLLLALQLLLADRARLAREPRLRPALQRICNALGCRLPPWQEPGAFRILARDVRATRPGTLAVGATFRNDARWPQAWPRLRLSLADANGRTIAAREFQPREYLGAGTRAGMIGSGESATFAFDVVDPGPGIVAFTFDFE